MRNGLVSPSIACALLLGASPAAGQPSAYEVLERLQTTYSRLTHYSDRGELRRIVVRADGSRREERYHFETAKAGQDFIFRLKEQGGGRSLVAWTHDTESWHYDSRRGQARRRPSFGVGLPELLGWPHGAYEALLIPLWLAEPSELGFEPEGASLEEDVACDTGPCDQLEASIRGGNVRAKIVFERRRGLVRHLRIRLLPAGALLARTMAEVRGTTPPPSGAERLYEVRFDDPRLDAVVDRFEPPPGTEVIERWSEAPAKDPAASEPLGGGPGADPAQTFRDVVNVREATLTLRAVDTHGAPLRELTPNDFEVRAGKRELEVLAVDWVSSSEPWGHDIPAAIRARYNVVLPAPGKIVVFFIQADMHPSRATGHLRLFSLADELVESFHPDDWVGVVSFDSRLKLRQELTRDHLRVSGALRRAVRHGKAEPFRRGPFPSIGSYLDEEEARRCAQPEEALLRLAEALTELPGEKVVIFVGWGLGRYGAGGVSLGRTYGEAASELARASATVFTLDVTQADYHSLEVGLKQVAADTGGSYASTFHFPGQATKRLAATLEGHYWLSVAVPPEVKDSKRLRVRLRNHRGEVLMPPTFVGGRR